MCYRVMIYLTYFLIFSHEIKRFFWNSVTCLKAKEFPPFEFSVVEEEISFPLKCRLCVSIWYYGVLLYCVHIISLRTFVEIFFARWLLPVYIYYIVYFMKIIYCLKLTDVSPTGYRAITSSWYFFHNITYLFVFI